MQAHFRGHLARKQVKEEKEKNGGKKPTGPGAVIAGAGPDRGQVQGNPTAYHVSEMPDYGNAATK